MKTLENNARQIFQKKRREKGMTQDAIAEVLHYESGATVSKKLAGKSGINIDEAFWLGEILGVPLDKIIVEWRESMEKQTNNLRGPAADDKNAKTSDWTEELYSYSGLGLPPSTCICVTDAMLVTGEVNHQTIENVITSFYLGLYEEAGYRQLYVYRALDGTVGLGFSGKYWDEQGEPEMPHFIVTNQADKRSEREVLQKTVKALSDAIAPLCATGIFVEREPGHWSVAHDGAKTGGWIKVECPACHGQGQPNAPALEE